MISTTKKIVSVVSTGKNFVGDGKESNMRNTPVPMAAAMHKEFPEISGTARLMPLFGDDKTLLQYRAANAEPNLFRMKGKVTWLTALSLRYLIIILSKATLLRHCRNLTTLY